MEIQEILDSNNIAEDISKEKRMEIGEMVVEHFEVDNTSRTEWLSRYEKWQNMAKQSMEKKDTPWPNAANIKYPLLTQAALNFNARIVPALMPNNEPVGAAAVGPDEDGMKMAVAKKIASHMNYQLITEMEEWQQQFDNLLISIAITGTEFKKTYYDAKKRRNVCKHVPPTKLVINYHAEDDIKDARKTEIHEWNRRSVQEKINRGEFIDIDWDMIESTPSSEDDERYGQHAKEQAGLEEPGKPDDTTPNTYLEYHGWYDFDEDGYEEPYIITVEKSSRQVLQITPRFTDSNIEKDADGNVIAIDPYESYTRFIFIPDPEGSFYGIGFGHLVYPINAAANTLINQLLDSGTLSNMPAGFISNNIKTRGNVTLSPGKWFTLSTVGDDLRKSMLPLPVNQPSVVLMNLLNFMVESAEKIASTTDIFSGEHPGQNSKTGVTEAVREEGQKVFTAVYKRIRLALRDELLKLFALNATILRAEQYAEEADKSLVTTSATVWEVTPDMYGDKYSIEPSADPTVAIKEKQLEKDMTALKIIMETQQGDVKEAMRRVFSTLEIKGIEKLLPEGQPNPGEMMAQMEQQKLQMEGQKIQADAKKAEVEAVRAQIDAQIKNTEAQIKEKEGQLKTLEIELKRFTETEKLRIDDKKVEYDNANKNRELDIKEREVAGKLMVEQESNAIQKDQNQMQKEIADDNGQLQRDQMNQQGDIENKKIDTQAATADKQLKSQEKQAADTNKIKDKEVTSRAKNDAEKNKQASRKAK